MSGSFCHASGISIIMAWAMDRPPATSSSSVLSNIAESLPPGRMTGSSFFTSSPNSGDSSSCSRACIQLTLPRRVLISPLWATYWSGWARSHDGKVFVLALIHAGVVQVRIELRDLLRHEQPLVDQPLGRQAAHAEHVGVTHACLADRLLDTLADDVQLALQLRLRLLGVRPADEDLADLGHDLTGDVAAGREVNRHLAPAEDLQALFADHLLEQQLALIQLVAEAGATGAGKEDHADAVLAGVGQAEPLLARAALQKLVRQLHEDASAIASPGIAAAGAAMGQVVEHAQPLLDDLV